MCSPLRDALRRKMICLSSFALLMVLNSNVPAGFLDDPSLVIYYSFDSVTDIVADQSGNGHDGVVIGEIRVETDGRFNGAANFARGSYLDLDGPLFSAEDIPTSGITLAAWVKCENTGGHHAIFNARSSDATWVIHPELRSNRQFRWMLRSYGNNTIFDIRAGSVSWYEWLHFAGTYDKVTGKATLYINGEVVREENVTSPRDIAGDWGRGARVGYNVDNARPFTGLMDDFFLFKRALPQTEILDVMEGSMAPTPTRNVYYVDDDATGKNDGSSWANAYVYLQDALADANSAQKPVEIRVAQGTYTPDCGNGYIRGDIEAKFFLKTGVTLKGGFAGIGADDPNAWDHNIYKTVLSGDLKGNDERLLENFIENSDHVIWCIDGDSSAVLDGFTITGGYAVDRVGGGLLNYNASPTVRRCVFFDNYASNGGGMGNRYSSPTVSECTFSGNLAPYGGGGMYNDYSHPSVESCVFYDNWTWYLGGGGMYCGGDDPNITNCIFIDNSAPFGGGMYNAAANPTIINCTFSNNNGGAWGGGMQNDAGANPRVTNCILWGDIPDEISFPGTGEVTYSNVQGGWAGTGNINRDPKFADSEGRLSAGSPCIDAGNNDAVSSDITTDLDGNSRIINGTVDMGAYEFGSSPPGPSADPLAEALDTTLGFTTGGYEDWFSQTDTYYQGYDAAQSGGITDDQESLLQTTVSGARTISFFWKVSSEGNYDCLEFYIDGTLEGQISGSEDWHEMTYDITDSGSHTLEWRYFKDSSMGRGDDCGWVDKVEWLSN